MIPASAVPGLQNQHRTRVLVVDDERMVADTLGIILQNRNHDVRIAYSGEQAKKMAVGFKPHAVITDVIMGPLNGIDLAVHLIEALPGCRVLLVSGHFDTKALINAAEKNGHHFPLLAKPAHPTELISFVESRQKLAASDSPCPPQLRSEG
jgi:DNA-binding NtrC family response regulator